jgi:hypothetical protein
MMIFDKTWRVQKMRHTFTFFGLSIKHARMVGFEFVYPPICCTPDRKIDIKHPENGNAPFNRLILDIDITPKTKDVTSNIKNVTPKCDDFDLYLGL